MKSRIRKGERRWKEFETNSEYIKFCKHIAKLYMVNKDMSLRGLCRYIREEYGVAAYPEKVRKILTKYGIEIRKTKKYRPNHPDPRPSMTVRIQQYVHDHIADFDDRFEGKHIRKEFIDFAFDLMVGKPTRNLIVWVDDTKPVHVLYNARTENFTMIGNNLSQLEMKTLEPIMAQVQQEQTTEPLKLYAQSKGLLFWGSHSESEIRNAKITLP